MAIDLRNLHCVSVAAEELNLVRAVRSAGHRAEMIELIGQAPNARSRRAIATGYGWTGTL